MKRLLQAVAGIALALSLLPFSVSASVLTFDDAITGATSYQFDSDGDGIFDVIFTTNDPFGFNTVGPGPNMTYIVEPGLEGSTLVTPTDLRVDFLNGALNSLSFGFALDDFQETANTWTDFKVYDGAGNLLGSDFQLGHYTTLPGGQQSTFPEGFISVNFAGTARYAIFDFNNDPSGGQRYIIDNFAGTFGSTEVPEGGVTLVLLGLALAGLSATARRQ